jgi:hypothetical protein
VLAGHGLPSRVIASAPKLGFRLLCSGLPRSNSNATREPTPRRQVGAPSGARLKPESGQIRPLAKACGVLSSSTSFGTWKSRRASAVLASTCMAEAKGALAHGGKPLLVRRTAHTESA